MTNNTNKLHFATRQIHGGYHIDETCARGIAIHPTAAFHFKSCDTAANLFSLSEAGNIYTRLNNPTNTDFENRIASLYGGVGALAVSSGMAAITVIVTSLASRGDNIVASPYLYGGTYNSFRITLRNLGIECRIAEDDSNESIEKLIDQNTKLIYLESMGNPTCDVVDIDGISKIAKHYDLPLVVDNTFGGCGYLCNPFDWGANIVLESATKWINGHGTAIGGVIVDGGNYNWGNGKYPQIDGPSEGYHGLNLWEAFGPSAFIVKARVDGLRDLGCSPSPFDTYLHLIGLETLSLRIEHQVAATRRLAEYCRTSPFIKKVSYVGFENHRSYANARKYFKHGASGVLNIELKGDVESTVRFVEALQLCANMVMIGDSITVVTHPASTTHKQLSDADLKAAGVTPTLLRISLGLEDVEDIISDFEQAFKKTVK
ncbi:O-acetylhomoserine aminocarboxypropyltransferase/cysteine synthase family protein [Prevotella corporis]|uniref:O-acetylhomoserine aminocarboxypropyltransferase/cysteine synthase family protein n=1 Tax=Prevotella corporis TaxID=28128 RepID=UPI0023F08D19|nr:aminotransferase class I/II-fold pyridoxal phosphate-dependent enzyme [Prevotella corporis]